MFGLWLNRAFKVKRLPDACAECGDVIPRGEAEEVYGRLLCIRCTDLFEKIKMMIDREEKTNKFIRRIS